MKENIDRISVEAPGWAQSLELSTSHPTEGEFTERINVPKDTRVLVLTASASPSSWEPTESLFVDLRNEEEEESLTKDSRNDENVFVVSDNGRASVVVVNNPRPGWWRLTLRATNRSLFRINLATFKEHLQMPTVWRCRLCKLLMAALAAAIISAVAAGAVAALPAALVAAITAALGPIVLAAVLGALAGMRGRSVDIVAEILCQSAGLCPG
jgi:hypothetical protein